MFEKSGNEYFWRQKYGNEVTDVHSIQNFCGFLDNDENDLHLKEVKLLFANIKDFVRTHVDFKYKFKLFQAMAKKK